MYSQPHTSRHYSECNKNKGDVKNSGAYPGNLISERLFSLKDTNLLSISQVIKLNQTYLFSNKLIFLFTLSYPVMARGTHEDNMSFSKNKELNFPANLSILCTTVIP